MQRDFKIGLFLGLAVVAAAVLWLSTRPNLSTKGRMASLRSAEPVDETVVEQPRFVTELPDVPSGEAAGEAEENDVSKTAYKQTKEVKNQKLHIVRRGETPSDIAYRYYGSASNWRKILEANGLEPGDAKKLRPGTKLIIPE